MAEPVTAVADPVVDLGPITAVLAARAATIYRSALPREVSTSVRRRVLDVLGLCVAAQELPTSRMILEYAGSQGGAARATAIGSDTLLPASQAAFVNGVLAHSLDFDDTHLPSVLHPSATVIPVGLAVAEMCGSNGAELTAAVAIGLEITVRLGMAGYDHELGNSVFFEHGQHATSICGAMGGAVTAALLMGLGEEGVRHALGIAASMAAGIIEANRTGGTVKRLHCGWAAHSAVNAAELVKAGFTGPPTVLEGRFGFFEAFLHGQVDLSGITAGFGENWSVPGIFFKPYPANHFTHAAIDAGLKLRAAGINLAQIARISVGVPAAVIRTIGEPIEMKRTPETGYQAQFSGPYAVVAGLLGGSGLGVTLADFTDALALDVERRRLMSLVEIVPDVMCDAIFPRQFPARVTVTYHDGTILRAEVLANRGGSEWPLTEAELATKFRVNVSNRLDEAVATSLEIAVLGLNELSTITELLAPLRNLLPKLT